MAVGRVSKIPEQDQFESFVARESIRFLRTLPESDLQGYEVGWRETTDPDWTHVIPVGNVTTVTLPHFSRDNVFFGVRAVDESGHRSPASFASP